MYSESIKSDNIMAKACTLDLEVCQQYAHKVLLGMTYTGTGTVRFWKVHTFKGNRIGELHFPYKLHTGFMYKSFALQGSRLPLKVKYWEHKVRHAQQDVHTLYMVCFCKVPLK